MDLFVGSLPLNIDETKLKNLFEIYATVSSIKIIKDKETGHSKGFGFVSIPSEEEALIAMNKIHGQLVENTRICVKKAYNKKSFPQKRTFISKKWQEKAAEKA